MSLIRNDDVLWYHPLDSDTEYTKSYDWARSAKGIFDTGVIVSGFTQSDSTIASITGSKTGGGYDDLEGYDHFTVAFWSSGLYGGTVRDDSVYIGFSATATQLRNGLRFRTIESTGFEYVALEKGAVGGPSKLIPLVPSTEGWHLTVVDFSLQGSTWRHLVSIDGSGWQNIGSGHTADLPTGDGNCSLILNLESVAAGSEAIIDEAIVWAGHDVFTESELSNLYELVNTYDSPMSAYGSIFGTPANSGTDCFIHGHQSTTVGKIIVSRDNTRKIYIADLDGSNVEELYDTGIGTINHIIVDQKHKTIYWNDITTDSIYIVGIDGNNPSVVIQTGLLTPQGLAIDEINDRLYFSDQTITKIKYSDLDGTNEVTILDAGDGLGVPLGIDIHEASGHIYWADPSNDHIRRANLDGTSITDVVTGIPNPVWLAIDSINDKLYWVESSLNTLNKSNLDGSDVEIIASGLNASFIAIDSTSEFLYVTSPSLSLVRRINLSTLDIENITSEIPSPKSMDIDYNLDSVYLYIPGQKEVKSTDLFVDSHAPTSGDIDLHISGTPTIASSSIDLYTAAPSPSSSGVDLYVVGPLSESGNIDNFIHGHEIPSGSIDQYTYGYSPFSGNIDLYVSGVPAISSSINLYTVGPLLSSSNVDDFTWGHLPLSGDSSMFIKGLFPTIDAFVSTVSNNPSNSISLFIHSVPIGESGIFYIGDSISLFINDSGDKNTVNSNWSSFAKVDDAIAVGESGVWPSFVKGGNVANDNIAMYINSHASGESPRGILTTNSINLFVEGQSLSSGDESLLDDGYSAANLETSAFAKVHLGLNDTVDMYTSGAIVAVPPSASLDLFTFGISGVQSNSFTSYVFGLENTNNEVDLFAFGIQDISSGNATLYIEVTNIGSLNKTMNLYSHGF